MGTSKNSDFLDEAQGTAQRMTRKPSVLQKTKVSAET